MRRYWGSNVEVVEDSQKNSLVIGTGRHEEVPCSSKSKIKSLKRRGTRKSEHTIGYIDSNHEAVRDASSVQRNSCASKHKERIPEVSHSSKRLGKTLRRSERLKSGGTAEHVDANHEAERNSFVVNCTEGNEEASRSSKSTSKPLKRQGKKQKKQKKQDVAENVDSELEAK